MFFYRIIVTLSNIPWHLGVVSVWVFLVPVWVFLVPVWVFLVPVWVF